MKKFLFLLAFVLSMSAWASAETVTISMAEQYGSATISKATAITVDGVTITPEQAGASNAPSYNKAGDLRNYANGTVTISADVNIKSISFEISSQGLKRLATITPSEGEIAEQGANPLVWNGEAKSIVFTVGEKADYGTEGASKAGQFCITSVTVELDGESSGDNSGDDDSGAVEPETPSLSSIAEFIEKNDTKTTYIVNFPLTVGYCTSTSVFVADENDGVIQIYKKGATFDYSEGDIIPAGWEATLTSYKGTPELVPAGDLPAATGTGEYPLLDVIGSDITAELVNHVIDIPSVKFAEDTPSNRVSFTGTSDDTTVTFYNSYSIESVEAGTYDVRGIVIVFNSDVQVYPIEYTKIETEEEVEGNTLVYKWDDDAEESVAADKPIYVEYAIEDGTITLPNFLGSDLTFVMTPEGTGYVAHNLEAGTYEGTFNLGSFGTYSKIKLYAGKWGYYDFGYYIFDGVKTLIAGFYADDDWFNLEIALPEDFEPNDPYADKETIDIPVTYNSTETYAAKGFVEDGTLTFTDLFGAKGITYTLDEDGTLTPGQTQQYFACSFGDEEWVYIYGGSKASYDATTCIVTDQVYFDGSGDDYAISFAFPGAEPIEAAEGNTLVYKYDWDAYDYVLSDNPIQVDYTIDGGTVTLPNFLDSDLTFNVTVYNTGEAVLDQSAEYLAGPFIMGSYGAVDGIYLYGSDDFVYYEEDGAKILSLRVFEYTNWDYFRLDITLPEDFEPAEPEVVVLPEHARFTATATVSGYYSKASAEVELTGIYDGKTLVINNYLGGPDQIVYYIENGKISGGVPSGFYPSSMDLTLGDKVYDSGYSYGTYARYNAAKGIVSDTFYGYEKDSNYGNSEWITVKFQVPELLETSVCKWENNKAVETDAPVQIAAYIDGASIVLPNFLDSDKSFSMVVYDSGKVEDGETAGAIEGSYYAGSFGTYSDIYIYSGSWNYDNFKYYIEDDVKTLHFGAYFEEDWLDLYITLPDDFEPADPYAEKDVFQLTVNLGDKSEQYRAFVEDDQLNIIGLFGMSDLATYTFDASGNITSSFKRANWFSVDYTYNDVANTYCYIYGNQYLSYDAKSNVVSDYIWFYETNAGDNYTFTLPEGLTVGLTASLAKWNAEDYTVDKAQKTIKVRANISGSEITLPNFLGADFTITLQASTNGKVSHDKDAGVYEGNFTFGEYGTFDSLTLYAGKWAVEDFKYEEANGDKLLKGSFYLGSNEDWFYIDIVLPDSYEPYDPFAEQGLVEIPVTIVGGETYTFHGVVNENSLAFEDLFGALGITYTIDENGALVGPSAYYNTEFTYNGVENSRIYIYSGNRLSYDATTATVTDCVYFLGNCEEAYFTFQLPEAFRPTTSVNVIALDENAYPVEYYNLQGVRVENPSTGIYIRRQGNKVQKVIVK